MDGTNLDLLLKISGMVELLGKSLGFLIDNPRDEQMRQTTAECVNSIGKFVNEEIFRELISVLDGKEELNSNKLSQIRDSVMGQLTVNMYAQIADKLNEIMSIDGGTADKLFEIIKNNPLSNFESVNLTYMICDKAAFVRPLDSYIHTIRLFEAQPGMLSGENTPHPGYFYKESEQRTFNECPCCGGKGMPYYRAFSYRMADFEYPDLPVKLWMKCEKCGNLYTWQYPEGRIAYSDIDQQMIQPEEDKYITTLGDTNGESLAMWYDVLARLTLFTPGKSLLEVGIGKGELLAVALELGFGITAVELVPGTAKHVADMLNIPVWQADFLKFKTTNRYSIITMGDVLEHVTNPKRALEKAYDLLTDDGVLWISTPNYESSFSRMRKFDDAMWMEPHHISYFSYNGICKLAENCGFEICDYSVSRRYNGSMELILKKK